MTLEELITELQKIEESRGVVSHDIKTNVTEVVIAKGVGGKEYIRLTPADYHCANCGVKGQMTHNVYCHDCYNKA